ncbi:hypothetical protein E4U59_006146 [Claviceps monticola]|nr:hypothetical protein E4U59_006146 [Claviceps monticola]
MTFVRSTPRACPGLKSDSYADPRRYLNNMLDQRMDDWNLSCIILNSYGPGMASLVGTDENGRTMYFCDAESNWKKFAAAVNSLESGF